MNIPYGNVGALARDYPSSPWNLWSTILFTTFLVRYDQVAPLTPPPLDVVRLPGGMATAYLAVARHGAPSTVEYSELVAGIMVRHRARVRPLPYVLWSGVDDARVVRAGQTLWHLPHTLWQFVWDFDERETKVQVWDTTRLILTIEEVPIRTRLFPLRFKVGVLTMSNVHEAGLLTIDLAVRVARISWRLRIGPDGPLAPLKPVGPSLTSVVKGTAELSPLRPLEQ